MGKQNTQISFAVTFTVTAKLISAFVFAIRIVQSLYYLNPKFQASSHLLWLYSLVCVGQGLIPEHWFSHDAAHLGFKAHQDDFIHLEPCQSLGGAENHPHADLGLFHSYKMIRN